jgi:hypothetical protein
LNNWNIQKNTEMYPVMNDTPAQAIQACYIQVVSVDMFYHNLQTENKFLLRAATIRHPMPNA